MSRACSFPLLLSIVDGQKMALKHRQQYLPSQVMFPPSPAATDPNVSSSDLSAPPGAGSLVPLGTHHIH